MCSKGTSYRSEINRRNASKPRISTALRRGIRAFVWEGLSREDAAQRANMKPASFMKALRKPHVRALVDQEFKELRSGERFQAYARMVALSETAQSEDVRLRANQWIAGVGGLAPVSRVRGHIALTHGFEGYAYSQTTDDEADSKWDRARTPGEDYSDFHDLSR